MPPATLNIITAKGSELRVGTAYLLPKEVLFSISTAESVRVLPEQGYQYPYLSLGTNFLFSSVK